MRILDAYCLNYNIGDYALGIGMKNLLRHFLNVDFIGDTNIQGRYFDEYYIDEVVNKRYDLLVLGGGGIIHGSHWPNGWFWLIEKDLIQRIKIPFIIYGIGDNYWNSEEIPSRTIAHIVETNRCARFFSVRNDGSLKRVINQFGILPSEVPDPGFFVGLNTEYKRPCEKEYIIVQIADDKSEKRFGTVKNRDYFIKNMRSVLYLLSKKYHIILAPHVYEDVKISEEIIDGIDNCSIWNFSLFAFDHVPDAVAYYKYARFVIAMRGHGQILPIGFSVPAIALCNHPKHRGLMNNLNLDEYAIDVVDNYFVEKLNESISRIENNYEEIANLLVKKNKMMYSSAEEAFVKIQNQIR